MQRYIGRVFSQGFDLNLNVSIWSDDFPALDVDYSESVLI